MGLQPQDLSSTLRTSSDIAPDQREQAKAGSSSQTLPKARIEREELKKLATRNTVPARSVPSETKVEQGSLVFTNLNSNSSSIVPHHTTSLGVARAFQVPERERVQVVKSGPSSTISDDISSMAQSLAENSFDTGKVDTGSMYKQLSAKLSQEGIRDPEVIRGLVGKFEEEFDSKRQELHDSLPWHQRWGRNCKKIAGGTQILGKLIEKGSKKVWGVVTSKETWNKVGEVLRDPQTWKKAGELALKGGKIALKGIAKGIVHVVTDPIGSIKNVFKFGKNISDSIGLTQAAVGLFKFSTAGIRYTYDLATTGSFKTANANLGNNLQAGLDGLKGAGQCFCEVVGLADAYHAIKHTGEGLIALEEGNELKAAMHFGQAAMYGTFAVASAGSIVATFATGGAAAGSIVLVATGRVAAKEAMKQVTKQGLKILSRELAESVVENIGKEVLSAAGREIAEASGKEVVQELEQKVVAEGAGALSKEAVEVSSKKAAAKHAEVVLKELKLAEHVAKDSQELFKNLAKGAKGKGELFDSLVKGGLSKTDAKAALKEMDSIVKQQRRKLLQSSRSNPLTSVAEEGLSQLDKELVEQLNQTLAKELTEKIYVESGEVFADALKKGLSTGSLREAVEIGAKKVGSTAAKHSEELVEAGVKGFKEGLEETVQRLSRKGLVQALRAARRANLDNDLNGGSFGSSTSNTHESALADFGSLNTGQDSELAFTLGEGSSAGKIGIDDDLMPEHKFEVRVLPNGDIQVTEFKFVGEGKQEVGRYTYDADDPLAEFVS